jgi:hypothetical protein
LGVFFLVFTSQASAGNVRSIYTDETAMVPINLRMGHSTVLRFLEKPKKVILGNSNYYSVEFIDNDVAIQPQGTIATNLFVYGQKNVYGFLLKTESQGNYDDLVHVRWKEPLIQTPSMAILKVSPIREVSRPRVGFSVASVLGVVVERISRFERSDFYILDLDLKNIARRDIDLSDFHIEAAQNKYKLSPQEFVIRDIQLHTGQKTAVRFFVRILKKVDTTLRIRFKNWTGNKILPKKLL